MLLKEARLAKPPCDLDKSFTVKGLFYYKVILIYTMCDEFN